jgi:hypothetical protein
VQGRHKVSPMLRALASNSVMCHSVVVRPKGCPYESQREHRRSLGQLAKLWQHSPAVDVVKCAHAVDTNKGSIGICSGLYQVTSTICVRFSGQRVLTRGTRLCHFGAKLSCKCFGHQLAERISSDNGPRSSGIFLQSGEASECQCPSDVARDVAPRLLLLFCDACLQFGCGLIVQGSWSYFKRGTGKGPRKAFSWNDCNAAANTLRSNSNGAAGL